MNSDLEGAFRCAHLSSQRGIRRLGLIKKEALQPVEMVQAPVLYEFGALSVLDRVVERLRAAASFKSRYRK